MKKVRRLPSLSLTSVILILSFILGFLYSEPTVAFKENFHFESTEKQAGQVEGVTTLVSVASNGEQANNDSDQFAMSADGRFIAFRSHATNLVDNDINNAADIFLHDLITGQTIRISEDEDGTGANRGASQPSISADGRYIAFQSASTNLVDNVSNIFQDIYVHDRITGQKILVSVAENGIEGNHHSSDPSISANGRYIAFYSNADNLVSYDSNGSGGDTFVRDMVTGVTEIVSLDANGELGEGGGGDPSISADGRFISFTHLRSLDESDTNSNVDVYLHDRVTNRTRLISIGYDGSSGNATSDRSSISADGRYISFHSYATNLIVNDLNNNPDVFVHDRITGKTIRVSEDLVGVGGNDYSVPNSISADGRFIAFGSLADNLHEDDTDSLPDAFVLDRLTGLIDLVSLSSNGTKGNDGSAIYQDSSISADGRYIVFRSHADNLVEEDTNGESDIFIRDRGKIATSPECSFALPERQPLIFVTGWGGSDGQVSLLQDDQLKYFADYLEVYGYVEGCNLFYVTGTTPYAYLNQNAAIIRDEICRAAEQMKAFTPSWNGHFDIIGHSYGGLRARAYLENKDLYGEEQECKYSYRGQVVKVDNLFTLGTPHGGEPYPSGFTTDLLPLSTYIGMCAIKPSLPSCSGTDGIQLPALIEMWPYVRSWENNYYSQPPGVCYYALAGDARSQLFFSYPPNSFLDSLLYPWKEVWVEANDLAVHQDSAFVLTNFSKDYPNLVITNTIDLHGHLPKNIFGNHNYQSYVNPNTTFVQKMWPIIRDRTSCQPNNYALSEQTDTEILSEGIQSVQGSPITTATPLIEVDVGTISGSEVVTGQFDLNNVGDSRINLSWLAGDLSFSLTDPFDTEITSDNVSGNPDADYLNLDTGFGLMSSYIITNTHSGIWSYTITSTEVIPATDYRLFVVPEEPIDVSVTAPSWLPLNDTANITATVTYSDTELLTGGTITAQIQRPDSLVVTIDLFDDGTHQDGAAADGIFGASYSQTDQGGYYGILITADGIYKGESYNRTASSLLAVAGATASLNGQYSDNGLDDPSDGLGLYDWLEIYAEVSVNQSGIYAISADLYAGSTFIAHTNSEVWLEPGSPQVIQLLFNGSTIRSAMENGPYIVRNVMLLDKTAATLLIETADNVHTTTAYNYEQFGNAQNLYLPSILRN